MTRCPAIIAALPREVNGLVRGWPRREVAEHMWVWMNGSAVVACAGLGVERAAIAVEAAMAEMPVTDLISVGLAGACKSALHVGDIVRAGVVIDDTRGDRFENSQFRQVLITTRTIASVSEKERLHREYCADAVDMEAACVAYMARERGLGFEAIKAISDEADFGMEDLSRFATADGQFREGAFARYAVLRPWMWRKTIALGRNSSVAVAALTEKLQYTLDWYEKQN